jgi:hypothetical protein
MTAAVRNKLRKELLARLKAGQPLSSPLNLDMYDRLKDEFGPLAADCFASRLDAGRTDASHDFEQSVERLIGLIEKSTPTEKSNWAGNGKVAGAGAAAAAIGALPWTDLASALGWAVVAALVLLVLSEIVSRLKLSDLSRQQTFHLTKLLIYVAFAVAVVSLIYGLLTKDSSADTQATSQKSN